MTFRGPYPALGVSPGTHFRSGEREMSIHKQASENILSFLSDGRLIQQTWSSEREGRHVACLLGAAGGYSSTKECPAELMPGWLAECTVTLFDGLAPEDVAPISKRYGDLIGRWGAIADVGWDDILTRFLMRTIDQAIESVPTYAKKKEYWPAI